MTRTFLAEESFAYPYNLPLDGFRRRQPPGVAVLRGAVVRGTTKIAGMKLPAG
ncbi:hypothetical protein FRAHR75_1060006 [Frankia sp. Hr75.2]|nr:hypothetical protein FRAHR75_1060006 [Frankia sp. Hr75.2]